MYQSKSPICSCCGYVGLHESVQKITSYDISHTLVITASTHNHILPIYHLLQQPHGGVTLTPITAASLITWLHLGGTCGFETRETPSLPTLVPIEITPAVEALVRRHQQIIISQARSNVDLKPSKASGAINVIIVKFLGSYMYAEANGADTPDRARLQSPPFQDSNFYCVSFFYHIYGQGVGELSLYYRSDTGQEDRIWYIIASQDRT